MEICEQGLVLAAAMTPFTITENSGVAGFFNFHRSSSSRNPRCVSAMSTSLRCRAQRMGTADPWLLNLYPDERLAETVLGIKETAAVRGIAAERFDFAETESSLSSPAGIVCIRSRVSCSRSLATSNPADRHTSGKSEWSLNKYSSAIRLWRKGPETHSRIVLTTTACHRRFSILASRSVIRVAFVILASVPSYRPKRKGPPRAFGKSNDRAKRRFPAAGSCEVLLFADVRMT